jgi:hypothetical protein
LAREFAIPLRDAPVPDGEPWGERQVWFASPDDHVQFRVDVQLGLEFDEASAALLIRRQRRPPWFRQPGLVVVDARCRASFVPNGEPPTADGSMTMSTNGAGAGESPWRPSMGSMRAGSLLHHSPRWTIVVRAEEAALYTKLRQRFAAAPWVTVVLDRRRHDRRQAPGLPPAERRLADRRTNDRTDPTRPRTHRLGQREAGATVYELMELAAGECSMCGAVVWFEMPRFGEPPVHLRLEVEHEAVTPKRARHLVALDAFGATGRGLLSLRMVARAAGAGVR